MKKKKEEEEEEETGVLNIACNLINFFFFGRVSVLWLNGH